MAEVDLTPKPSYAEASREKKAKDIVEKVEGEQEKKEKHIEKVAQGKRKKKPAAKKVGEAIIGEDMSEVKSYLIWDVLIPAVKDTIADLVKKGIDAMLFGGTQAPRNVHREGGRSRASYSDYYDRNKRGRDDRRLRRPSRRAIHSFDDILFEDRFSAENVLSCMEDITMDYGMVSVADFYELAGEEAQYTDNKYGWGDVRDAEVVRTRDGWIIDLPKPEPID
jgi:hypothetical protein